MKRFLKDRDVPGIDILSVGFAKSEFYPLLTKYQEANYHYYYLFNKFLIFKNKKKED